MAGEIALVIILIVGVLAFLGFIVNSIGPEDGNWWR